MANTGSTMELVTKPGTKAPVWEFFGLKKAEDGTGIDNGNVYCRACRRKVVANQTL
jgi:hypothetical protein